MPHAAARTFVLVGPGRAGSSVALALVAHGWRAIAVSGRRDDSPSTRHAVARLGAPPVPVAEAGADADLVLIATPDAEIDTVADAIAPNLDPGSLVVHLSGARGVEALFPILDVRPDVRVGALHPLQTFAGPDPERLNGAWAAVAGPPAVTELAIELGMRPFVITDDARASYHAAAVVASNHLVALLGQVERLAAAAVVPFAAFVPLMRASFENATAHTPALALTGPVARGDLATVAAHLDALPAGEHDAYRALARAALALTGRDDPALAALLDGVTA